MSVLLNAVFISFLRLLGFLDLKKKKSVGGDLSAVFWGEFKEFVVLTHQKVVLQLLFRTGP